LVLPQWTPFFHTSIWSIALWEHWIKEGFGFIIYIRLQIITWKPTSKSVLPFSQLIRNQTLNIHNSYEGLWRRDRITLQSNIRNLASSLTEENPSSVLCSRLELVFPKLYSTIHFLSVSYSAIQKWNVNIFLGKLHICVATWQKTLWTFLGVVHSVSRLPNEPQSYTIITQISAIIW
jgi:hypothetical protein